LPASLVPIRRQIEDNIKEQRDNVEIDVWLESPGGDAHTAFKLALMLRHAAKHIRVVIPDYAKSAATLLALAGHVIYVAPGAEMGPLDAQMPEEGSLAGSISALNIARAADEVARDAVALVVRGGLDVLRLTGLTRAQTFDTMLQFSAAFSEPLVRQLDPRVVHDAKQMLKVTKLYAERLLEETTVGNRAGRIATRLVEDFPTHGFVICFEEAKALGLPVRPIAEYDQLDVARPLHRAAEDGSELVGLFTLEELLSLKEEDDGGNKAGARNLEAGNGLQEEGGSAGAE
jgi:hypothetical protein